jgi:hypothetical protein
MVTVTSSVTLIQRPGRRGSTAPATTGATSSHIRRRCTPGQIPRRISWRALSYGYSLNSRQDGKQCFRPGVERARRSLPPITDGAGSLPASSKRRRISGPGADGDELARPLSVRKRTDGRTIAELRIRRRRRRMPQGIGRWQRRPAPSRVRSAVELDALVIAASVSSFVARAERHRHWASSRVMPRHIAHPNLGRVTR